MANNAVATTGLLPLCLGSVEVFQLQADIDGLPWDLTGGTVSLVLADPSGNKTTLACNVIPGGDAQAAWTVAGATGQWTRAWTVVDAVGRKQVSRPIPFAVISSPV